MNASYLRYLFRSLSRQKYFFSINITGLAIGLAAFILIALFVKHELSYDRYHQDADLIFRIARKQYTCSPPPMAPTLKEVIPEIEYSTRFIRSTNLLVSVEEQSFTEDEYFWADSEFFDVFSVDFTQGDPDHVLESPNEVLISERIARKYFGREDPMGRLIVDSRENVFSVAGVFREFPSNSHFHFDIVFSIDRYFQTSGNDPKSWGSNYTYSYVKLFPGADMDQVNGKLVDLEKELTGWDEASGEAYEQYFFFQAITEIHLHSHRRQELEANGNIKNVYIFSSIGLLILIIAAINYINLGAAMAGKRHKEVGMKKVLGLGNIGLVRQFLGESVLVAFLSALGATVLVALTLPFFGRLMDRELALGLKDIPFLILLVFVLTVLVGLGTGLLPSRSLSRLNIVSTIRGSSSTGPDRKYLRSLLIASQFVVAIVLIILSINVQRQLNFISDKDPGYEKENILVFRIFDRSLGPNLQIMREQLLAHDDVLSVSTAYKLPHLITDFRRPEWFCEDPSNCDPISYNEVDYDYVDLFNIGIVEGRNFSREFPSDAEGAFLVNEKAVAMAGWDSPLGTEIEHYTGQKGKIVGVVKDFHFQSMHAEIAPLYLILNDRAYSYFAIKTGTGDIQATLDHIQSIFHKFSPLTPFQYTHFNEEFEELYKAEKRLGFIFSYFSTLAIFLGCLGIFSMSAYLIGQRTKELGMRKIFGAMTLDNMLLLGKRFMWPVLMANLLAWPLAYNALNRWLESFAYRSPVDLTSFLLASLLVLLITALTSSMHSGKIARQSPVESIRCE